MPQKNRQFLPGFTVIEVMIVLAIAGIIIVMILVAIPQLQRNSRDLARRHYADRIYSQIQEFYTNNRHYPETDDERDHFTDSYLPKDKDPKTGANYNATFFDYNSAGHDFVPGIGEVAMTLAHWCNNKTNVGDTEPDNNPITGFGHQTYKSRFVVWIGLEGGRTYCIDNYDNSLPTP